MAIAISAMTEEMIVSEFGERLAKAIIKAGYTRQKPSWFEGKDLSEFTKELKQTELANDIRDISVDTINRHLHGKKSLHIDDLKTYARHLGVSTDWLLGVSDQMVPVGNLPQRTEPRTLITCKDKSKPDDLYAIMGQAANYTGFEENTHYLELIKKIFCSASASNHGKPLEDVNFLVKLFYLDYLFFLLTIASASSLVESEFFRHNMRRNITILNYLFILLPHQLNNRVDAKLQRYITTLLEVEIRPNTRQSIENLFCITSLAFFWLSNTQSFNMILALKSNGTQIVVDLVNHVIQEQSLPLQRIRMTTSQNQIQLHKIREQIRALIKEQIR